MKSILIHTISKKNFIFFLLALFGCIYSIIIVCNHYYFRTYCLDYGAYNFAFYDIAHFRLSDSGAYLQPHVNFLQDHISFTLYLFIPLYWGLTWLTGTYTLLLLQLAFILFGGWAVYKLIELKTSDIFLSSLALLQYLIIFGRWTSFVLDCNWTIFAASMIPVLMYYIEKRKVLLTVVVLVFVLLAREDMALWTGFIGIFYLVFYYKERSIRYMSIAIIIISFAYFIFIFTLIIPLFETQFKKFSLFEYSALGKKPFEASMFILKHPFETLKLLFVNQSGDHTFDNVKFEFYYVYFLSGGFLLFYRPKYLILFIPIIAKKMLNDAPIRWSIELYYSIEFVSILPVVVFLIISENKKRTVRILLACIVTISTLTVTTIKLLGNNRTVDWWGDSKYAFYKSNFYKSTLDVKKVCHNLGIIPANAKYLHRYLIFNSTKVENNLFCWFLKSDCEIFSFFILLIYSGNKLTTVTIPQVH